MHAYNCNGKFLEHFQRTSNAKVTLSSTSQRIRHMEVDREWQMAKIPYISTGLSAFITPLHAKLHTERDIITVILTVRLSVCHTPVLCQK